MAVPQVQGPNIFGAFNAGFDLGQKREARNALMAATQESGPLSPQAMQHQTFLNPQFGARVALQQSDAQRQQGQFDARMAEDRSQFDAGMGLRREQFEFQRGQASEQRRQAAAALALRKTQMDYDRMDAAQKAKAAELGAVLGTILGRPDEQSRAQAWAATRQFYAGQGADVSAFPEEYPGTDAAAVLYSTLTREIWKGEKPAADPNAQLLALMEGADIDPDSPEGKELFRTAAARKAGGGAGMQVRVGPDGSVELGTNGLPDTATPDKGVQRRMNADGTGYVEEAIPGSKLELEQKAAQRKQELALSRYAMKASIFDAEVEKAVTLIDQYGRYAAGVGSWLSSLPETPARELRNAIETIKANIGFDELEAMRAASLNGGALGNVTEMEIKFLQSTLGSLDQAREPKELAATLIKIRDRRREFAAERARIIAGGRQGGAQGEASGRLTLQARANQLKAQGMSPSDAAKVLGAEGYSWSE